MNRPIGAKGEIINFPFIDLQETIYNQDGIEIEIKDGILSVGVDTEDKLDIAKDKADLFLSIWSKRQNIKVNVTFTETWKSNGDDGKTLSLELGDTVKIIDRIQLSQATMQGVARIVTQEMHDSASFNNDLAMFEKALKYPVLKNALLYFSQEVVDNDRPLYGVYKALEVITKHLGSDGRKKLASLANQPEKYVQDIMETTQSIRHSNSDGNRKIGDNECKLRTRILIDVFFRSLT